MGNRAARWSVRAACLGCVVVLGCTWVDLTDSGRAVTLAQPAQVVGCRKVGTTNTKVLHRVFFINRSATRVARELSDLARNEAPPLGGDTVVPATKIERGAQTFDIYRCAP